MKTIPKLLLLGLCCLAATSAQAAERTVILAVEGMTCASCPYIVKQTLASVEGVTAVDVSFAEQTATVTYDDSSTGVTTLTSATAGVGFPSSLKEQASQ